MKNLTQKIADQNLILKKLKQEKRIEIIAEESKKIRPVLFDRKLENIRKEKQSLLDDGSYELNCKWRSKETSMEVTFSSIKDKKRRKEIWKRVFKKYHKEDEPKNE